MTLVEELKARAKKLQSAADVLFKAAAILDGESSQQADVSAAGMELPGLETAAAPKKWGSKVGAVKELIRSNGPLLRKEIKLKTGWNHAKVSTTLGNKKHFFKGEDDRYRIREEK